MILLNSIFYLLKGTIYSAKKGDPNAQGNGSREAVDNRKWSEAFMVTAPTL